MRRLLFPNKRGNLNRAEQRHVRMRMEAIAATSEQGGSAGAGGALGRSSGSLTHSAMRADFTDVEEMVDVLLEKFYDCHDSYDRLDVLSDHLQTEIGSLKEQNEKLQEELSDKKSLVVQKHIRIMTLENEKLALQQKNMALEGEDTALLDMDTSELTDLLGTISNTICSIQAIQKARHDTVQMEKCYVCRAAVPNRCLPCGHMYCDACVGRLDNRCGMCRAVFDSAAIIRVWNAIAP